MKRINTFFRDSHKKESDITVEAIDEHNLEVACRRWKPITLRRPFLSAVSLVTAGLLALVQILVVQDQRYGGIFFAPKISELEVWQIFLYRYLPTIISVSYGLVWHWIDLDTRRVEPYRQLSKSGGANGEDSLLLHYPTDLLAFVPLKALKRKHWSVVISSAALVLVGMGLTPLQAAMFARETVTASYAEPMQLSTQRLSIPDQVAHVTANYTYSVANIVWLGERLPRFMTRDAALVPFAPLERRSARDDETWTAGTTLFSMDVQCEDAALNQTGKTWQSSHGCNVGVSFGPTGMEVINNTAEPEVKDYTPFFAGYQNHDGLADYYLGPYCPESASNVFMVALARNRRSEDDAPGAVTRLFCETSYYEQNLTATISRLDGSVLNTSDHGPKVALKPGTFNTSLLEWQINSAMQQNTVRSEVPSTKWPDQSPQLSQLPISFPESYVKMKHIVALAMGAYPNPAEDYMDSRILAKAFQAAHRLLFARAMVDVLPVEFDAAEVINGTRRYETQAIRVIPHFAFAVESVLATVALMAVALMIISWGEFLNLVTDPDSISALMLLVQGQNGILRQCAPHDQSTWKTLRAKTCESTYILTRPHSDQACTLELQDDPIQRSETELGGMRHLKNKAEYPVEFSLAAGTVFTFALVGALAATAYFYQTGEADGLALPSQNQIIRQILENYIPMVIATLIEPVWVVLNRLLCLLQPFEELRSGNALPHRSIKLEYSSLPPQFTLLKALKAQHFVLAAVCAMALLANVLAVAFGAMFNEEIIPVARSIELAQLFDASFRTNFENATKSAPNPFYMAMANFTSDTPMPAWTDDAAFYLPVLIPAGLNNSDHLHVSNVPSFGVKVSCESLRDQNKYSWDLKSGSFNESIASRANLTISISGDGQDALQCSSESLSFGTSHYPLPCSEQPMALEVLTPLVSRPDAAKSKSDACRQLIAGIWTRRSTRGLCENETFAIHNDDAMAMVCKPTVFTQLVNVTVNGQGVVQNVQRSDTHSTVPENAKIIKEASHALFDPFGAQDAFSFDDWGGIWHNDSYPSSWNTYIMNMMAPDSSFLDSELPVPAFEDMAQLFARAYQKVFAIWLGVNHEVLMVPAQASGPDVTGVVTQPEIRIKVSRPMVILACTILSLYIVVSVAVYARRPGKYLPRMPLTMASDIAMFAASTFMEDMQADARGSGSEHYPQFGSGGVKFGYGTFVGTDGKSHVGIERAPFVVPS